MQLTKELYNTDNVIDEEDFLCDLLDCNNIGLIRCEVCYEDLKRVVLYCSHKCREKYWWDHRDLHYAGERTCRIKGVKQCNHCKDIRDSRESERDFKWQKYEEFLESMTID